MSLRVKNYLEKVGILDGLFGLITCGLEGFDSISWSGGSAINIKEVVGIIGKDSRAEIEKEKKDERDIELALNPSLNRSKESILEEVRYDLLRQLDPVVFLPDCSNLSGMTPIGRITLFGLISPLQKLRIPQQSFPFLVDRQ